ncbi:MAG: hypothetical protein LH654_09015, partial [Thermoleophilia bacterium]|nr:hypothetical protein [Thermoleophilia bacterium]
RVQRDAVPRVYVGGDKKVDEATFSRLLDVILEARYANRPIEVEDAEAVLRKRMAEGRES